MTEFTTPEAIWELFERGKEYHRRIDLYGKVRKNYDFFEGRQWEGLKADVEPPVDNIIKHIVQYKYNVMAMQDIQTVFTTSNPDDTEHANALTQYAKELWKHAKIHGKSWETAKHANIAGNHYLYFADESKIQSIDTTDIHFANENSDDIQGQKYILIVERLFASDVRAFAEANGKSEEEISLIVPDEEINERKNVVEVKSKDGRCTSLLLMWKKDGTVRFLRAVKNVIYEDEKDTTLELYPVVGLSINKRKGSCRGIGEVEPLIPNQIALNKTLYRRIEALKHIAFPKMVYKHGSIENPEALTRAGGVIAIKNQNANEINKILSYIQPSYIGNDAKEITDELILVTKELNGSGDGATGQINPEKVSGEAVKAVTQQASISSSENQSAYVDFIESIGKIILEWWKKYNPNGLEANFTNAEGTQNIAIPSEVLQGVKLEINVSPATPYDKFAVEQALERYMVAGYISFDEFVESLDENCNLPKAQLEKILENRRKAQESQQALIINELQKKLARYEANEIIPNQTMMEGV